MIYNRGNFKQMIQDGLEEPISYNIFRQAKSSFHQQPSSTLLLSYLAAEIAIKDLICIKIPDANWLVMNLQSPPLEKILSEFFHVLPDTKRIFGESWKMPSLFLIEVRKFTSQRNELTHQGAMKDIKGNALRAMQIANNIIWLCEILKGHEWARDYLDDEAKKDLGISGNPPNE